MINRYGFSFNTINTLILITIALCSVNLHSAVAQTADTTESGQIIPFRSGVDIMDFTGSLSYFNVYRPCYQCENGLKEEWRTRIKAEFRNLSMLNSHWGIGYKVFVSAIMTGFFETGGLGGFGAGPLVRLYPLKTTRWQPYLQTGVIAGYNLGLGGAAGIADVGGFRFRTHLLAGITYRFSNVFGIFLEAGRRWEYERGSGLRAREWQVNIGIELFHF